MKKKKMFFVLLLVITLLLLVAFVVGTSYSKYTTTVQGKGTSSIAKWSFKANEEKEVISTITLKDTYDATKLVDGKIAPGTSGKFQIVVDATDCDVGLLYKVDFQNEKEKPTNLRFKMGDLTVSTLEALEDELTGIIGANDTQKQRTMEITWGWPYETTEGEQDINDKMDTNEAMYLENYTFDIAITGTQLIPTKEVNS